MARRGSELGEGEEPVKPAASDLPPLDGGGVVEPLMDVGSATSTAPSSLTAGFKIAKQASKGTGASTGFLIGRVVQSGGAPAFDYTTSADEHYYATSVRATSNKSMSRRNSYTVPWAVRGYLHPELYGMLLVAGGFAAVSTGAAPAYTHPFKIAARSAVPWTTICESIGEGANQIERKIIDCRATQISVTGSAGGLMLAAQGLGRIEETAAGTEAGTVEPEELVLPSAGQKVTIDINGEELVSAIRSVEIRHTQALDTREMMLWSFGRPDLPQQAVAWTFALRGIDVTKDVFRMLTYGSIAGTGPSRVCPSGEVNFKFESAGNIPTGVVPYSIAWAAPKVEWRMGNIVASGADLIRFDLQGIMIDEAAGTDPLTVTLVNGKASY